MNGRFPIPPGVVAKVVEAAADPETTVADLTKLIEKDAVLTAQVLKTVNSAFFGLRRKIAAVDRAITFMGMRAVRNLVLALGVKELVPTQAIGGFPLDLFWEYSLRRAAAARALAELLELTPADEFFTLGLCQDIGVLVQVGQNETIAKGLAEALREPAERRLLIEQEAGYGHAEVGFAMFTEWKFPEELSIPIRYHHRPDETEEPHRRRARVSHAAEAVADLSMVADKQAAMRVVVERTVGLGLDAEVVSDLVGQVNDLVSEFAELLGLNVKDQPTFEQIIAMASQGLVSMNVAYESATQRLEGVLEEQTRKTAELEELTQELQEKALTDELTGLANRRAFDEALRRELAVAEQQGTTLSLLLIDIDHFKEVNDLNSHQAGDLVLQHVARAIQSHTRKTDTAARQGGDEFAVIFPFADAATARNIAERIRSSIETMTVPWPHKPLKVTGSLGGLTLETVERSDARSAELAMRQADDALYESKEAGRNLINWKESVSA